MTSDTARTRDRIVPALEAHRPRLDVARIVGHGTYRLVDADGRVKLEGSFRNLITDVGDEYNAKRSAGAAINAASGMRLGTGGSTAASKNGAGAAIVTYVTGSQQAFEATYPQTSDLGASLGYRQTFRCIWIAGDVTQSGIDEAVITNETPLTDVAGTAANTLARAVLAPVINKGASDQLTIDWHFDYLGA